MKTVIKTKYIWALAVALLAPAAESRETVVDLTYAVEINGTVCGYADLDGAMIDNRGAPYMEYTQKIFVMSTLLGATVNTNMDMTFHVDPDTKELLWFKSSIDQADFKLEAEVTIEGDTARCWSSLTGKTTLVPLTDDVIREGPLHAYHIKRDFIDGDATEKTYDVFSLQEFRVEETTVTRVGAETIELDGRQYETIIVEILNHPSGIKLQSWVEVEEGTTVKLVVAESRNIYLADPSIRKTIELVNLDEQIVTRTNVAISDIQGISYMKIKARIKPTGLVLTAEDLNVPGQSFTGTVEGNLIEGVFEIEHPRYDGAGAPPFPADFGGDEAIAPYLKAAVLIESEDPVLAARALEITEGSADSWEAACRLSEWVAKNIGYAIPGGGNPRNVYDLRAGECGGHSFLLASFCRAVDIPARVVWGCMYMPNFGGAFGQHAWNEIYMGDAGWITVDATAMETDFVDSGHIRVGEYQSLSTAVNTEVMEVLDHRLSSTVSIEDAVSAFERYDPYVGEYQHERGGDPFKVLVENGSLALDIPNQMVLGFNDPGDDGVWTCKLSNALYCTFDTNRKGEVKEMVLHEVAQMPRRSDPETIDDKVPDGLRPVLGGYYFAALKGEFLIGWNGRNLTIFDPSDNETTILKDGDTEGIWIDRNERFAISFETLDDGTVTLMKLDAANRFEKK